MKKPRNYPQKLFLAYSCIYMTALLIFFLIVLGLFYQQQYKKTQENQSQIVSKISEQIDVSLQNMDQIANGLLFNNTFLELMKNSTTQQRYNEASKQILNTFTALDAPLFSTHRIIAFNDFYYYNLSKSGENQSYMKLAIANWPWAESLWEHSGKKIFIPPHQDTFDDLPCYVYSVARPVSVGSVNYGTIEIQKDYTELEKLCSLNTQYGQIVVYSPDGQIIYPLSAGSENTGFFNQLFTSLKSVTETRSSNTVAQTYYEKNHISLLYSEYSGWITALYCPTAQMVPNTPQWLLTILMLFLLFAISFMVAIHIVTDRMTAPLTHLNEALKEVSLNNLSIELPQQYGIVEIENINHSFLVMFEHLKKSIAENIQSRANEERANYLALQSQMNPHTIYNTIGMIESVSYMNGDEEVSRLCICFSHMLRYISDFKQQQYLVRDELKHLENYAVLIQTRYGDRLKITTEAEEELLDQAIPKFTLQPLVENAVKHGFSHTHSHLSIQIVIKRDGCGWYILIRDNGCGMTLERLTEIYEQLSHCDECLSTNQDVLNMRIGNLTLSNIYIRWRIMFGSRLQFTIANNEDSCGCFIQLTVKEEEIYHD